MRPANFSCHPAQVCSSEGLFYRHKIWIAIVFLRIVKSVCSAEVVRGDGLKDWMTTNGQRGTLVTSFSENGHADSSVSMRTGDRDFSSLKHYKHNRGGEGKRLQRDFVGDIKENASKRSCVSTLPRDSPPPFLASSVPFKSLTFSGINNFTSNTMDVTIHNYIRP